MTTHLFKYIVFGNIYISICAVVMLMQTRTLFSLEMNKLFIPFIFFSTMSSYSLHWSLTDHTNHMSMRMKWSKEHRKLLATMFIISILLAILFFLPLAEYYKILLPLAFITFLYTAPKIPFRPFKYFRNLTLLKTTYLALVWVFTTCVLPVIVSSKTWSYGMTLFTLNRLFLIFPVCLLFDYRDRYEDSIEGIKNIAILVSGSGLNIIFAVCTLISIVSGIMFYNISGGAFVLAANIAPSLILAAIFSKSKQSKSDILFYFFLDGLMMLSGIIILTKNLLL